MDAATGTSCCPLVRRRLKRRNIAAMKPRITTMVSAASTPSSSVSCSLISSMLLLLCVPHIHNNVGVPIIHAFSFSWMKPFVHHRPSIIPSALFLSSSSSSQPQQPPLPSSSSQLQPPFLHPSSPEEAIQNQLHYYQTNQLSKAYHSCCSPGNKKATGSLLEFERLVNLPPYDLIVGHERADVLLELVMKPPSLQSLSSSGDDEDDAVDDDDEDDEDEDEEDSIVKDVACCLVCIRPNRKSRNKGHPVWFWWEMSLIEMNMSTPTSIAEDFGYDGDLLSMPASSSSLELAGTSTDTDTITRWMVDCIQPDFEDLDFETEALSIENFLDDTDADDEEGEDDDDDDELTIYWDFNM